MDRKNPIIACGLAFTLAFGTCVPAAYAVPTQEEVNDAKNKMNQLTSELSDLETQMDIKLGEMQKTQYEIDTKQQDIEETQQQLGVARKTLGKRVRANYKTGNASVIQVLLGSTGVADFVNRVYFMDKIAEEDAATIENVQTLSTKLEQEQDELSNKKAQQTQQLADMQQQSAVLESKQAEAKEYYNQLNTELQEEIKRQREEAEKRRQEELERRAREEAERARREEEQRRQEEEQQSHNRPSNNGGGSSNNPSSNGGGSSSGGSSSGGSSNVKPTPPVVTPTPASGGGISTARGCIGCPYVWGATGPNAFDCSGLVCYSYGYAHGRTTYAMIASLKSQGRWKTSMSQLQPGDLIFPHSGHVGIYVGGGRMIHASRPGVGVVEGPVYAFIGGGTY